MGVALLGAVVLLVALGGSSPRRWSKSPRAELTAAAGHAPADVDGVRHVVGRDQLQRHKTLASVSDIVPVGLVGFAAPIALLSIGEGPDGPVRWYAFVAGAVVAIGAAHVVLHRHRLTEVSVVDSVVVARDPWRTRRIDTTEYPMWRQKRHGLTRCVEFVGADLVASVTVVALPPELLDRVVELIDMDQAIAPIIAARDAVSDDTIEG